MKSPWPPPRRGRKRSKTKKTDHLTDPLRRSCDEQVEESKIATAVSKETSLPFLPSEPGEPVTVTLRAQGDQVKRRLTRCALPRPRDSGFDGRGRAESESGSQWSLVIRHYATTRRQRRPREMSRSFPSLLPPPGGDGGAAIDCAAMESVMSVQFGRFYLRHRIAIASSSTAASPRPSCLAPTPNGGSGGGGGDELFGKRAHSPPSVSQSVSDSHRGGRGRCYMLHAANRFSSACERSAGGK